MAFTEKRLAGPIAVADNTQTLLYSCPSSQATTTLVKQILMSNSSAAESKTVVMNLVPDGSSVENSNRILSGVSIPPSETLILDLSQVMVSGDFLTVMVSGSGGSSISITISGVENAGGMVVSGLADSAVTTAKIADGNVTASKLGPDAFLANNQAGAIITMEMM